MGGGLAANVDYARIEPPRKSFGAPLHQHVVFHRNSGLASGVSRRIQNAAGHTCQS